MPMIRAKPPVTAGIHDSRHKQRAPSQFPANVPPERLSQLANTAPHSNSRDGRSTPALHEPQPHPQAVRAQKVAPAVREAAGRTQYTTERRARSTAAHAAARKVPAVHALRSHVAIELPPSPAAVAVVAEKVEKVEKVGVALDLQRVPRPLPRGERVLGGPRKKSAELMTGPAGGRARGHFPRLSRPPPRRLPLPEPRGTDPRVRPPNRILAVAKHSGSQVTLHRMKGPKFSGVGLRGRCQQELHQKKEGRDQGADPRPSARHTRPTAPPCCPPRLPFETGSSAPACPRARSPCPPSCLCARAPKRRGGC